MSDLIQRARDIAAGFWLSQMRVLDENHPDLRDDEHRVRYVNYMRQGLYDEEAIVQATYAALREGIDLAVVRQETVQ